MHLGFAKRSRWGLTYAIERYCGIRINNKDKTTRSLLVAEAQRAQVYQVDQAWKVFLIFVYSNLFTSGSISTWRVAERFFVEFLGFFFNNTSSCYLMFASLFLYSLYFTFIVYCLCSCTRVVLVYCTSFTLVLYLDKLE